MRSKGTRLAFTLVELMVAGVIASFVLGAVTVSLSQLSRAKTSGKRHLEAYLRADAAMSALRRDIVSVLRRQDLFYTRVLLQDSHVSSPIGQLERDELLVFNNVLLPTRDLAFTGDGMEFETHYRIEDDGVGPVLWRRRDVMPDEYPRGGGVATPLVPGVLSFSMEAYDGEVWLDEWDSDYDGIPHAIRITIVASGHRDTEDPFDAPRATLRTVVALDRVVLPGEPPQDDEADGEDPGAFPDGVLPPGVTPDMLPPGTVPGDFTGGGGGGRGGGGGSGGGGSRPPDSGVGRPD